MSPRFVLGWENVPCVAEVVNRSLKADCTDYAMIFVVTTLRIILSDYSKILMQCLCQISTATWEGGLRCLLEKI